jgi:hypothetical protein
MTEETANTVADQEVRQDDQQTPEALPEPDLSRLKGAWKALAAPFPKDEIEWKPQPTTQDKTKYACRPGTNASADGLHCGGYHAKSVHLAYIGHAGITMRLNEVDPTWDWEPVSITPMGTPAMSDGGLWIRLTVLGVTRLGFGDPGRSTGPNGVKEMIGDAIRNAAMRFGVGTYLWSKSEKADRLRAGDLEDEQPAPAPQQQAQPQQQAPANVWTAEHETKFAHDKTANWEHLENLTAMTRWYVTHTPLPNQYREMLAQQIQALTQQRQQQGANA